MAFAFETHNGSAQVQRDGTVNLTRTFRIYTGNAASRPAWGVALIGIFKYDIHPDDATCRAIEVNSNPVSGELGWFDVSYTYSNRPFDAGTADQTANGGEPGQTDPTVQPDPILRTPTFRWNSNPRTINLELDFNPDDGRQPTTNSALQPFEGGIQTESYVGTMVLNFNMPGNTDVVGKKLAYENTLNDAPFTPLPDFGLYTTARLKCNRWDGTIQYETGYGWYCAAEVELEYRKDGFTLEVLDAGYYENVIGGGGGFVKLVRPIDKQTGFSIDGPVKLNGRGLMLNPGDNPTPPSPYFVVNGGTDNVSVYKRIYPYERVDWTNIFA